MNAREISLKVTLVVTSEKVIPTGISDYLGVQPTKTFRQLSLRETMI